MNLLKVVALLLCIIASPFAHAEHNSLLPRPQQITYGTGSIMLRGMNVTFSSSPSEEDRFAASELCSLLRDRTGEVISIVSYGKNDSQKATIVLDRSGGTDEPLAQPGEIPGQASREAYDLIVTDIGVRIHARSSAGIFYGVQTLRQIVEGEGSDSVLPVVEIHDWPSLAFRGTMVDISHGPMPKEKEIENQLDFLSRWKANQYYIYSEDSIELTGYPLLNAGAARMSKDEVRRIVAYGRQRHIDVIPNFDLYGHQHDLFRIEQYADLSDQPHGSEFDAENPKVMPLLADWVNQFIDLFPSPFVSIGFDETFQLKAAARTSSEATAPTNVFLKQLTIVSNLFQKHGKQVMVYDDIMVKYPKIIPNLPSGVIAVAWYYTSEDPTYQYWLGPLVAHHIPHVVQPGVTSYNDITPDNATTFENIDTFLVAGKKSGAFALINSVWGDDAQLLFRMSLPGMAYGAVAPWQSVPMDRNNFFMDYAHQMYPATIAPDIALALNNMSESQSALRKVYGGNSMVTFWEDPFLLFNYKKSATHREDLHKARIYAERAETSLYHAESLGADASTVNSLMIGSQMLDYAGEKYQAALELTDIWNRFDGKRPDPGRWWDEWQSRSTDSDHSYVVDLMDRIADLKSTYRAEWLDEYTPYRLGSALGRWDAEFQFWRNVHNKLLYFNDATHEGDILPPLNEVINDNYSSRNPAK